jgi:hypothetical protein
MWIEMNLALREGSWMDFIGVIVREPDSPGIDNRRSLDLIR